MIQLCTGDLSFSAAVKYDLEVWAPGCGRVARGQLVQQLRGFPGAAREHPLPAGAGAKPEFVHTLNGSGLALPRVLIAVIENYQQADGSIVVPEVLRPYMGGLARIG